MSKHKLPEYIKDSGKMCEYGCGQEAHYNLTNGKWCCSERYHKCPEKRKLQSEAQKNRKDLIESGKRLGKSNKGIKHSLETRQKLSIIQKKIAENPEELERRRLQQLEYHQRMTEEEKKNYKILRSRTIERIKETYPLLYIVEELRYKPGFEEEKIIQARCKNHNCMNSKEKNGWFDVDGRQLEQRGYVLKLGLDGGYLYCSEYCKQTCSMYRKSDNQLINSLENYSTNLKFYSSQEYQDFRQIVLEREDYKCQYCDNKASIVHHEKPQKTHPNLTIDPDNGIACCLECHYKYGHKQGTECSTGNLAKLVCTETN